MTAISDYFRTALLIDDRVAADYGPLEALDDVQAEGGEKEPTEGLVEPSEADATPVHPADLVRAFFASGVVCSVLEPVSGSSDLVQQALRGAQIADLLILDWLLYGSDAMSLEIINEIASERAERLTVIVVFTGMSGLGDVAQRLVDDAQFDAVNNHALRRGNTVVLVFGKPGARLTDGEDWRQPASYGDLPRMIRDDLEVLFKGLMPEFAFSGINALRESAPRILATFNADLDAGALIHRALLPNPDDAAAQFIRLLASDFEQVLHDSSVGDVWNIDSSSETLETVITGDDPSPLAKKLRGSSKVSDDLKESDDDELTRKAISRGLAGIGLGDSAVKKVSGDLVKTVLNAGPSNKKLAVLINSSGIGLDPPRLELGIVLRRAPSVTEVPESEEEPVSDQDANQHHWLCVQPLCDSVRLQEPRAFPLVPVVTDSDSPSAMVCPPDGEPVGISFVTNLHHLKQARFAPTDARAVVAEGSPNNWYFTDVNNVRYDVVARLRPDLAAHVVHKLGTAATRVGTDQSEWLRRGARS